MKVTLQFFLLIKVLFVAALFSSCSDSSVPSFSFTAVRSFSDFPSDYSKIVSDSVNSTLANNNDISAWKVTPITANSCEVVVFFKKGAKPTDRELQRIQELVMSNIK